MDFKRRLTGLQERMHELNLDLVVYGSCQNFQYLTGLVTEWRRGVDLQSSVNNVFVPATGDPILTASEGLGAAATWIKDIRVLARGESYRDLAKRVVSDLGIKGTRIGIGDHVWGAVLADVSEAVVGAELVAAESLMDHLRMTKDSEEIQLLREVAKLTDSVMERVLPKIQEGVTQKELSLEVEFQGRRLGASDISFGPTAGFVKSGSEVSENPFTYPREMGLVLGTSIAFDIGFVMNGYCSDFGRSFYFGPSNEEVRKAYEALHLGVVETVDKMHSESMRVCDLFPALEKTLDRCGYGNYLRARLKTGNLGHQIGVEVHEPPWLSPSYMETLKTNMVMALEPKVWHAGEYYLRVEDIVVVGPNKTEFLTNFDRQVFQL